MVVSLGVPIFRVFTVVNSSLKFQMLIPEICQYFLLKICEKL